MLKKDGWYIVNTAGHHHQFERDKAKVIHPTKDIPPKILKTIFKKWMAIAILFAKEVKHK